jgi:hypothetical protein
VRWEEFAKSGREIAELAEDRFRRSELCMVGTLRADGSPRISPCELDFAAGELFLGMMWRSRKALDLLRDPRCVLHSCTGNRMGIEGDAKIYGRAVDVQDPELRRIYREAVTARIDWAPEEPNFHAFAIDVGSAAYISFADDDHRVLAWDPARGMRSLPFPDAE